MIDACHLMASNTFHFGEWKPRHAGKSSFRTICPCTYWPRPLLAKTIPFSHQKIWVRWRRSGGCRLVLLSPLRTICSFTKYGAAESLALRHIPMSTLPTGQLLQGPVLVRSRPYVFYHIRPLCHFHSLSCQMTTRINSVGRTCNNVITLPNVICIDTMQAAYFSPWSFSHCCRLS